eukprot:7749651-Pyramimonas_sp.AAC.1
MLRISFATAIVCFTAVCAVPTEGYASDSLEPLDEGEDGLLGERFARIDPPTGAGRHLLQT